MVTVANRPIQEVQYFAKDIALFSTILKDLGNALSKGQTSNLYREDAYQTGFGIARECEEVFQEIQGILNKFNKNGGTASVSTIFRKSRVQLLRGRLEFLKSRILLQVAVLSYAERASTSSYVGTSQILCCPVNQELETLRLMWTVFSR